MTYTFPSVSNAAKLPRIAIEGSVETYKQWFSDSHISTLVPPLYQDFCLSYRLTFDSKAHDYLCIVHYSDDATEYAACHVIDGKKVLELYVDYAENTDPGELIVHGFWPPSTPYKEDWLQRECKATGHLIAAIQAYILYHRPELIPTELPAQKTRKPGKPGKPGKRVTSIRPVRRQIIRLEAVDKIPVAKNYRAIQWQVRGHYRRIKGADGVQKLVYVRPHMAQRGKKKLAPAEIVVKEVPHD